jgi:bifunctional non-homologous end joining protein LigD
MNVPCSSSSEEGDGRAARPEKNSGLAMGLKAYQDKRRFSKTPEPRGEAAPESQTGGRLFVVQKHQARRLHYDFRLELNGVLLSWAVPKGPSLNPREKRLAVQVEDHPVEYADFEGVIPEGQYGAGTVLLWDAGYWIEDGDAVEGLRRGELKFRLEGRKLKGGWALVRMTGRGWRNGKDKWLLIKRKDESADLPGTRDVLIENPESVSTRRSLEQIRESAS